YSFYTDEWGIPAYIKTIGNMSPIAFFVYLGTEPPFKRIKIPMLLYLIYSISWIATGQRAQTVVGIFIVTTYLVIWMKRDLKNIINIRMKHIILMLILVPILISGLSAYKYTRLGQEINRNPILEFIDQQGGSINVIKRERIYNNELPNKVYSLGNTRKSIKG